MSGRRSLEAGLDQIVLGLVVMVERALRDVELGRDPLHRRAVVALVVDQAGWQRAGTARAKTVRCAPRIHQVDRQPSGSAWPGAIIPSQQHPFHALGERGRSRRAPTGPASPSPTRAAPASGGRECCDGRAPAAAHPGQQPARVTEHLHIGLVDLGTVQRAHVVEQGDLRGVSLRDLSAENRNRSDGGWTGVPARDAPMAWATSP